MPLAFRRAMEPLGTWNTGTTLQTVSMKPDDGIRAVCVSCGQISSLPPEALFAGLRICDECASHVHFPSQLKDPSWIGNAT